MDDGGTIRSQRHSRFLEAHGTQAEDRQIIILSSINRARIGSREMAPVERADRTRTGTVLVKVVDIQGEIA